MSFILKNLLKLTIVTVFKLSSQIVFSYLTQLVYVCGNVNEKYLPCDLKITSIVNVCKLISESVFMYLAQLVYVAV